MTTDTEDIKLRATAAIKDSNIDGYRNIAGELQDTTKGEFSKFSLSRFAFKTVDEETSTAFMEVVIEQFAVLMDKQLESMSSEMPQPVIDMMTNIASRFRELSEFVPENLSKTLNEFSECEDPFSMLSLLESAVEDAKQLEEELTDHLEACINSGIYAYTVGNPEAYDPTIENRPISKAIGGTAYKTYEEAKAELDAEPAGKLPPEWFDGTELPGAVYKIALPAPFEECVEIDDHGTGLTVIAPILGKVEGNKHQDAETFRRQQNKHRERIAERRGQSR